MNNKGFTLVELLATLVILSIVVGLTLSSFNFNFGKAKEKTEEVFVDTLRDAIDMYLSTETENLKIADEMISGEKKLMMCDNMLNKMYNKSSKVYILEKKGDSDSILSIKFNDIINSSYKILTKSEFVNPANKDVACNVNAVINVYRDEDYVYYYSIDKSKLACLKNTSGDYSSVISNLPEGYSCK